MKKVITYIIIALLTLGYTTSVEAKKRCKPLLAKLHNIQAMQRSGYSLKRGQSLRAREDKARAKWWACEHSSLAKFKEKYGSKSKSESENKSNKKKAEKSTKSAGKSLANNKKHYAKKNKETVKSPQKSTVFNQHSAIVIKSKYQGDKQRAWLGFYQQPIKCKHPKSMAVFVYCNEDKLKQQDDFEKVYGN
ncbi:hypothetical protein [Colwellia ponticola]|uniref:Uncharacterized protein n=1 Tax=Colwellia ponticola TaxID=2304625 RepID=A0A8H2JPH9_9GAMM|nr:hypothetical protein [Colwellia ponticola]TMM47704.1 hypothetical protein FCS21_01635 [Colwellia ponticola]